MKNNTVDQCVILLAGKGVRFLPATKVMAKELFPVENKPILLYHLSEAYRSGIKRVWLVISKEKEYIKDFVKHNSSLEESVAKSSIPHVLDELNEIIDNMQIDFIYQGNLTGTAGALMSAKEWTQNKPFVLMFGDDLRREPKGEKPVIKQMIDIYEKTHKSIMGTKFTPLEKVPSYSSIVIGNKVCERCFEISDIVEKPEIPPSNYIGLSPILLTPDVFDEIGKCKPLKNNEICLTDAIRFLAQKGKAVCYDFNAKYFDCGNKLDYIKCNIDFALHDETIADDLREWLKTI